MSAAALSALDRAGARWCLLREPTTRDGDVDVLVHPHDLPSVRRALAHAGFAELRAWGRRPHRFFVAADTKLDVVTELAFGRHHELRTAAAEPVLARRVWDGDVARPAPADRFWALLLHELLDRRETRRERELCALASGPVQDGPLAELFDAPGRIAALVADGRLEEVRRELRGRWPRSVPATARGGARAVLRRADRRLRSTG